MLVAEPIATHKSERYLCLDLLNTTFESVPAVQTEAILVEVWPSGGLLHTDCPAAPNCRLCLASPAGMVKGSALSCTKDEETGYVIEFAIAADQPWFPEAYLPPYLMPHTQDE